MILSDFGGASGLSLGTIGKKMRFKRYDFLSYGLPGGSLEWILAHFFAGLGPILSVFCYLFLCFCFMVELAARLL